MQLIIRLDDITPDMDINKFNRVREILDRNGIKPLIGVVPECRDNTLQKGEPMDGFWDLVHELIDSGWAVAQHGTYHVYETEDSGILGINPFSEFAGLPYDIQFEKLKAGRDILLSHGIHTDIFMAPGHTYDENTVKALKELGFSTITDGLYTQCYEYEGIVCVPCRLSSYSKVSGLDTICLHTNLMDDEDCVELEEFIKANNGDFVEFDIRSFIESAVPCTPAIRAAEAKVLARRVNKDKVANNARLSWYLSYTNHSDSKIKWLKRALLLPLLLTNKYKK